MNKKIEFSYKDNDYVLEYDRKSIEIMENNGLDLYAVKSKPASMISILWQGAFLKNHRKEKIERIQEIYNNISNKSDLNATLTEMVYETYSALFGDGDGENDSKNIDWKMS